MSTSPKKRGKVEKHNKWGYIFLIPFVVVYVIFQLIPLISTIYNSFYENYRQGLITVGPNFVGLANYKELFAGGYVPAFGSVVLGYAAEPEGFPFL